MLSSTMCFAHGWRFGCFSGMVRVSTGRVPMLERSRMRQSRLDHYREFEPLSISWVFMLAFDE